MFIKFWMENLKGTDDPEDRRKLGDMPTVQTDLKESEWTHVTRDSNWWRELLNTIVSLRVAYRTGNLALSDSLLKQEIVVELIVIIVFYTLDGNRCVVLLNSF